MVLSPNTDSDQKQKPSLLAAAYNILSVIIGASVIGYFLGLKFWDPLFGAFFGGLVGLIYSTYEIWIIVRSKD